MAPTPAAASDRPRPAGRAAWRPAENDVPSADLPLQARVERLARPLRTAAAELAERLEGSQVDAVSRCLALPEAAVDGFDVDAPGPASRRRTARALTAVWLLAQLRRDSLGAGDCSSAAAANSRFWGVEIPCPEPQGLEAMRAALERYGEAEAEALLPYLLDPFGPTTRRALLTGVGDLDERRARKRAGTFYTPGDVARLLTSEALVDPEATAIDPACGAGVFLRAAFSRLCCDLGVVPEQARTQLYGIDLDPCAVDACGLVLVHDWLAREPDPAPGAGAARLRLLRRNLAAGNSLSAFAGPAREAPVWRRFPERARSRFGCVLMNPPFAPTGEQAAGASRLSREYRTLAAASNAAGVNQAWPFAELALRAAGEGARLGVVLPLSLAYRSDAASVELRRLMATDAAWRLRFFDRAPDGVFGDDVKQRICLAAGHRAGRGRIATSRLIRWSSAKRAQAFRPGVGGFQGCADRDGAPLAKIGTALEAEVLARLRARGRALGEDLVEGRLALPADLPVDSETAVAVAPTAYNWIGAYRDLGLARAGRRATAGKLGLLVFAESREADAAYAVLASRVYLWWWRALGDLFHVPLGALTEAPFAPSTLAPAAIDSLAEAGRALWRRARTGAVMSTNRGVAVTAYRAPLLAAEVAAADRAAVAAFGLPARFGRFVATEASRLADAGRGEDG
jgi:N-6 DNA Methylase